MKTACADSHVVIAVEIAVPETPGYMASANAATYAAMGRAMMRVWLGDHMSSAPDFPYYNGQPVEIRPMGWLAILASVAVGFILLVQLPFPDFPLNLVPAILFTGLPLLALLWLCTRKLGLSRRVGLVIAVLVSTAVFAAVHLPTYDWNLIQCFGGIGSARLVLTAAFLVTRNLWVSTGAHIVNDWTEFLLPNLLALGHTPVEAGA